MNKPGSSLLELHEEELNEKVREANISKKPAVNILSQDQFRKRAEIIFDFTDEILGRSFGPYGAPTLISDYPYMEATKDGFTIARNITWDHIVGSQLDRIIYKMVMDICGRINYAVGDGTTTAIIATNQMYQEISKVESIKDSSSREILNYLDLIKDAVIAKLKDEITPITEENMSEVIRKITYVSSNADEEITNLITTAYDEFRYPVLRCDTADGPNTYIDINKGYKCKVRIGDRIYVNSSQNRSVYERLNVLVFDHQINARAYSEIIAPLAKLASYQRPAGITNVVRLVCIAPSYDDVTLNIKIRQDIMEEFKRSRDFDLIVMWYPKNNESDRKSIYDLAMLLNTDVIDRAKEQEILEAMEDDQTSVFDLVNVSGNDRNIKISGQYDYVVEQLVGGKQKRPSESDETSNTEKKYLLRAGYADELDGGMKESVFKVSAYDKELYEKFLEDAKSTLDETLNKFEILGTYTPDVYDARYRYTSLLMTSATIYVGGESKLSRDMRLAAVEDAVRAAESAYMNGYVLGCNVSLSRAISSVMNDLNVLGGSISVDLASACENAFKAVYRRVFDNYGKFDDGTVADLIDESIKTNRVYDLRSQSFSTDIINSARTDIEIFIATIDLLSILLSGNQVLISQYVHNEDDAEEK